MSTQDATGALDDAPMMGGDGGVDEVAAKASQARERPLLVDASQPAIADDIGHQESPRACGSRSCASPAESNLAQFSAGSRRNSRLGAKGSGHQRDPPSRR